MLNAAATLAGLVVLWLALSPRLETWSDAAAGLVAVSAALLIALRWNVFASGSAPPLGLVMARAARMVRGALGAMRASLAPRAARPGLVRLRTRGGAEAPRAAFASYVAAAPDIVLIEADADGLLVHALDEDGLDAGELARVEARLIDEVRAP